jgi:hypothetical protein
VLVPNDATMPLEVRGVPHVFEDFATAVDAVLAWTGRSVLGAAS